MIKLILGGATIGHIEKNFIHFLSIFCFDLYMDFPSLENRRIAYDDETPEKKTSFHVLLKLNVRKPVICH